MMRAEPLFSFNGSFSLPLPHETKEEMAFGEKKGLKMGGGGAKWREKGGNGEGFDEYCPTRQTLLLVLPTVVHNWTVLNRSFCPSFGRPPLPPHKVSLRWWGLVEDVWGKDLSNLRTFELYFVKGTRTWDFPSFWTVRSDCLILPPAIPPFASCPEDGGRKFLARASPFPSPCVFPGEVEAWGEEEAPTPPRHNHQVLFGREEGLAGWLSSETV